MPERTHDSIVLAGLPVADRQGAPGLSFSVAQTADDVLGAWQLVYNSYRRQGLIGVNAFQLHSCVHAFTDRSAVVIGRLGPVIVTTLTAILDTPLGLPLDRVYPTELAHLRQQGRRLMQIGLFGDRRKHLARTAEALVELMRFVYAYAQLCQATDVLIAVNPRHVQFYGGAFGCTQQGLGGIDPSLNHHPAALLRCDIAAVSALKQRPPALAFAADHPVDPGGFAARFPFTPEAMRGSRLEAFLEHLRSPSPAG